MEKPKKETGSITLMVLITLLFFMVVLSSIYIINTNRRANQLQEIEQIRQIYGRDVANVGEIYEEVINRTNKTGYKQNGLYLYWNAKTNTRAGEHQDGVTIWEDLSGNNRDGSLENFTMDNASGWKEQSLSLDGTDDYIETGISQTELGKNFTISTLLYTDEIKESRRNIWSIQWNPRTANKMERNQSTNRVWKYNCYSSTTRKVSKQMGGSDSSNKVRRKDTSIYRWKVIRRSE